MNSLREPRVPMQLRVEIHGTDWEGQPYRENTFTANISRTGTRLNHAASLRHVGQKIELRRGKEKAPYSVIWIGQPGSQVAGNVGLRLLDPIKNIWGVPLPPPVLVSSDEEWAELSKGLPGMTPINEAEEPPVAAQSAAPVATLDFDPVASPEGSVTTPNLNQGSVTEEPAEEPVATQETYQSRSIDEAFARLQADKSVAPAPQAPETPPPAIEPAETVEAAATDEPPPLFAGDEAAPAELPVPSVQPDTVTYGPQFLPEPSPPAAKPFYTRPVVYLGLGAALLILLIFSWNRTRTVPTTPPADSPVSASTAEPVAPPPAPVQETPPAPVQPQPTQTQRSQIEQVPTPQTPPKTETTPSAPAGNFAVQVGAYESAETAQALANSLGSRYDCKGVVDPVQTAGGKTLHRVRLLAGSQADAKALAARVRRERAFDAIVVRVE